MNDNNGKFGLWMNGHRYMEMQREQETSNVRPHHFFNHLNENWTIIDMMKTAEQNGNDSKILDYIF